MNSTTGCAAIYARYSSDNQSPLSIDDQVRKCREGADERGLKVPDAYVYADEAQSGAGFDRPALRRMIDAALSHPRPFDVIFVDDTSRLGRNIEETMGLVRRLQFAGVQLISVSQGFDSSHEQAEVLLTVHGLVDSLYLKELAKKTHRGMEGKALRGFNTGGRCFGYETRKNDGGARLQINESEANIVRRIFEMSADGSSLRTIAKTLNAERIGAPRPRKHSVAAGWCPTGIREMLYNEIYVGRRIWNRARFVKVPGTNRRVARPRPENEWKVFPDESLRIIPDALWRRVQARLKFQKETYGQGRPAGLLSRSATSPYLFSGLLVCSECGAKITIVSGSSRKGRASYGCSRSYSRGTCSNDLQEKREVIEAHLLAELQRAILKPEVVDRALRRFEEALRKETGKVSSLADDLRKRKAPLEAEIANLTRALADGYSAALTGELARRERELAELNARLDSGGPGSIQASMKDLRLKVTSRLSDIRNLLSCDVTKARTQIARHVDQIVLRPVEKGGKRFYLATGEWSLIGKEMGPAHDPAPLQLDVVAGARFERATFGL